MNARRMATAARKSERAYWANVNTLRGGEQAIGELLTAHVMHSRGRRIDGQGDLIENSPLFAAAGLAPQGDLFMVDRPDESTPVFSNVEALGNSRYTLTISPARRGGWIDAVLPVDEREACIVKSTYAGELSDGELIEHAYAYLEANL